MRSLSWPKCCLARTCAGFRKRRVQGSRAQATDTAGCPGASCTGAAAGRCGTADAAHPGTCQQRSGCWKPIDSMHIVAEGATQVISNGDNSDIGLLLLCTQDNISRATSHLAKHYRVHSLQVARVGQQAHVHTPPCSRKTAQAPVRPLSARLLCWVWRVQWCVECQRRGCQVISGLPRRRRVAGWRPATGGPAQHQQTIRSRAAVDDTEQVQRAAWIA
jgi:hypothetical protein